MVIESLIRPDDRPTTGSGLYLPTDDEVKTIHESIFWDEEDPRWNLIGKVSESKLGRGTQVVDLANDSYIWLFCGSRGAGKSLGMTYFAGKAVYLYDSRVISNYPIDFFITYMDGTPAKHVLSEDLDMYKLLCFDEDYKDCIILIDEAPDIISHLSAMTWKNRLLNIFIRQLRKNRNSLFLGSQQFSLIDKSMRWQTDIVIKCQDAFRLYGGSDDLVRGAEVLLDFFDNSGQWTGHSANIGHDGDMEYLQPDDSLQLPGALIWGAYDTYFQQDIWESLVRVDMRFQSYSVGKQEEPSDCLDRAGAVLCGLQS